MSQTDLRHTGENNNVEGKPFKEDSMKSPSTMILIAFVMLFASEAKAQVPRQPPRKKSVKLVKPQTKAEETPRDKCIRLLSAIEKVPKPTPEKCAKLQVAKVHAEPPRKKPAKPVKHRAKAETCCDKCARLLRDLQVKVQEPTPKEPAEPASPEAKEKEPPRNISIGFGVIADGKNMGGILTAEYIFLNRNIVKIGLSPKLSYMQGEIPIIGGFANDDMTVSKFDFSADMVIKVCPIKTFQLGFQLGMGLRFLNYGDTVVGQNSENGDVYGIEAGNDFNFLVTFAFVLDFTLTKSLRISAFYRNTTNIHHVTYFGSAIPGVSSIVEKGTYFDHVGGLLFSVLLP